MAIQIIKGCLLDALEKREVLEIGHCTNCRGVFGAGLAKQIKERFYWAYQSYFELWDDYSFDGREDKLLGSAQYTEAPSEDIAIWNLHAQLTTGTHKRQLNYGALGECLIHVADMTARETPIGFPYQMGSNLAGGDWNIVLEMIEHYFRNHEDVRIYRI